MSPRLLGRYAARSLIVRSLLLLSTPLAAYAAPAVTGDDATASPVEVENAKNSFPGIVNQNSVYVRCGPAESYYPMLKLDKGARVTVVGLKLDWLKITPPEGSFCYISKAFVDRNGDGTQGKVNKDSVNVRAGSALNSLKVVPLCQLSVGMEVKILGEQDEYFKIAPPEGKAFVYINKQFVEPDPEAKPKPIEPTKPIVAPPTLGTNTKPTGDNQPGPIVTQNPDTKTPIAPGPKINPITDTPVPPVENDQVAGPTTKPTTEFIAGATTKPVDDVAATEALFEKAEADFAAADRKPLGEQPIAALTQRYETLVASQTLTNTLHRIAETRLATLQARGEAAGKLAAAKAVQDESRKRQQALVSERKELEDRLEKVGVSMYTAVGELQSSSIQMGSKTLYRLTDPANGRTVCYVRSDDGKIVTHMGKFIGVKGDITNDTQLSLRVITPTEFAAVDPAKVNHGVTATVIPPSMIAAEEASTASHEQLP